MNGARRSTEEDGGAGAQDRHSAAGDGDRFSMFVVPGFRVPLLWALGAFLLGAAVLAYPLVKTSRLKIVGDQV